MASDQDKKRIKRIVLALSLVLWIAAAFGLVRLAGYLPYPAEEKWEAEYGWTGGIAVDRVSPEMMVGQAVRPPGPVSYLQVRFATYARKPVGKLRVVVLRGTAPPAGGEEISQRSIFETEINAGAVRDNELYPL